MPTLGEHKTVQARILAYAQEIGWSLVAREQAEHRRAGFPARFIRENGGQECSPSFDLTP
jgi:type I restriction enzyme R subunit